MRILSHIPVFQVQEHLSSIDNYALPRKKKKKKTMLNIDTAQHPQ